MKPTLSRLYTVVGFCVVAAALTSCQPPPQEEALHNQSVSGPGAARQSGGNGIDEYASASTNVFVGTVLEKTGTVARGGAPEAQFTVNTVGNLKGKVPDSATVNVYGTAPERPSPGGNVAAEIAEDAIILEVGQTYVFYTKHYAEKGWFTVSRPEMVDRVATSQRIRSAPGELMFRDPAVLRAQNAIALGKPLIRGNGEPLPTQAASTVSTPLRQSAGPQVSGVPQTTATTTAEPRETSPSTTTS